MDRLWATVFALALLFAAGLFAFTQDAVAAEKKVEAADADQGDIIKLNPKDESIGFTRTLLRDTSKDPKREPGPINIQRTDFGLAYTGIPTFFRLPVALTPDDLKAGKVDVAIMGASVDLSISRRGAGWTPQAFRTSEVYLPWGKGAELNSLHVDLNPFEELVCVDYGDAPIDPFSYEKSIAPVSNMVAEIAGAGSVPIIIGGDHSLMYMTVRGIADVYGRGKVGVIHFDAHVDAEAVGIGHILTHGSPVRLLIEEGHVKGENFVQIGLRGWMIGPHLIEWMRKHKINSHFMAEIEKDGWDKVMEGALKEAKSGGVEKIFISFDIDAMDPGVAPAAASPEANGLTPREVFPILRALAIQNEIVGMEMVEINALLDTNGATMLLANRIVREVLVGMALRKKGIEDPKYVDPDLITHANQ